jgi:hypothetical protein
MICSPDRTLLHQAQDAGAAADGVAVDAAAADGVAVDAAAVDGAGGVAVADDERCEPAPVWAPQPVKAASRIAPAAPAYLCFLMRSPPWPEQEQRQKPGWQYAQAAARNRRATRNYPKPRP